jgi:repressor LexA
LGVVSNQSIIDLLVKLEKQKFLRRNESSARSLTILPLGNKILGKPALIPFLGNTTAGAPMEALEIAGEWKQISPEIKEFKNDIFLLKVFGDSMINAGIESEDVVLVKEQKEFVSGDIVLANTDTGSTIKRFISEDKPPYVYLKPENPKYQNILFDENVIIKGKVISILKNGYWKPIK